MLKKISIDIFFAIECSKRYRSISFLPLNVERDIDRYFLLLWVVPKDIDLYLLDYTFVPNISLDILPDLQQFIAKSILRHVVDMSVEYVLSFHQPPWQLLWSSTAASKTCKLGFRPAQASRMLALPRLRVTGFLKTG